MTAAPRSDSESAKTLLRGAGLRATAARIAVVRELSAASAPRSHAEVVAALSDAGFDQSTLFRCLNELADAGIAARLDLGDHVRRFELTDAKNKGTADHAHFMCIDCGELSCLQGYTVQVKPRRGSKDSAVGLVTEVLLRGQCSKCAC